MSDDGLPTIRCEHPVAQFDGDFCTSRHTTDDGRFLVAWLDYGFSKSVDLIDLYMNEKT